MKKLAMILALLFAAIGCFAQKTQKRMAVATFDITGGAVTSEEADAITELYISELVGTGKVTVVDRANFDKIVKEMKFQSSDWSDKDKTAALGSAINANIIARGQVIKLGSKLYLSTTVIDARTAAILTSARKQFNNIDDIFNLLPSLASELMGSINYKIGDTGPGGGIIYYIEDNRYYECTGLIGKTDLKGAKKMCQEYRGGDYDDWYLPTSGDLKKIYQSLKSVGLSNADEYFWSSSLYFGSSGYPYVLRFSDGNDKSNDSYNTYCVRAVRAFND